MNIRHAEEGKTSNVKDQIWDILRFAETKDLGLNRNVFFGSIISPSHFSRFTFDE